MSEPTPCSNCGAELPVGTPKGLCPRCALQGALQLGEAPDALPAGKGCEGRSFGDYELLEEIARGGMGIVFKARQRKLDRIVAVKMILAGEFASREQALRFRVEAEAAARLQHPNIVRIHETGEQDGQPYFSMDYVEGGNLATLVRDQPLPGRRAASYVKTIAEAIHYAHEQGILHRDLKPSNVLIDQADQPHVTDFGLAKRMTKESFLTVTGDMMGSPNFMPPEQAGFRSSRREESQTEKIECPDQKPAGVQSLVASAAQKAKAGRYSDVYGLGAILFYLVTGRPPFVAENFAETLHRVLNTEPVSPRLLNPSVPQDIATICLKCLEKEPGKRYQTAQALADDLGCWLNDEPIHARPASRLERAWRWGRRHPAISILIACIITLVFAGGGVSTWLARDRNQLERKAKMEATGSDQTASFLGQMLASMRPSMARGRDTTVLREAVDKAVTQLATNSLSHQPRAEASLRNAIGAVYLELGEFAKAEGMFRESLALEEKMHGPDHAHVSRSLKQVAETLSHQGKLGDAEALLRRDVEVLTRLFGAESLEATAANSDLALVLVQREKFAEAESLLRDALLIRRKLLGAESREVAAALNRLGSTLMLWKRLDDAREIFHQALAVQKKLLGDEHEDVAATMENLGFIALQQGKLADAEGMFRQALAINRKVFGDDHPHVAGTLDKLATLFQQRGELNKAETSWRQALAIQEKLFGDHHPLVADILNKLATVLFQRGNFSESETLLQRALATRTERLGPEHAGTAQTMNTLALALGKQGKARAAEEMFRRLLAVQMKQFGTTHSNVVGTTYLLVKALMQQRKTNEAEILLRETLRAQQQHSADDLDAATTLNNLAMVLFDQGKSAEAMELFRQALTIRKRLQGSEHPDVIGPLRNLSTLLAQEERFAEAEQMFRELLALQKKVLGDKHADVAETLQLLAVALRRQGKSGDAEMGSSESQRINTNLRTNHPTRVAHSFTGRVEVLTQEQKPAGTTQPDARADLENVRLVTKEVSLGRMPVQAIPEKTVVSADCRHVAFPVVRSKHQSVVQDGVEGPQYERVDAITFSPDSRRLAYQALRDGKWIVVADGKEHRVFGSIGTNSPIFSPDSRHVAYVATRGAKSYVVVDGTEGAAFDGIGNGSLVYSLDSQRLAFTSRNLEEFSVVVNERTDPAFKAIFRGTLVFSPDSRRVAYAAEHDRMCVLMVDGQKRSIPNESSGIMGVTFSPDSKRLAYATEYRDKWAMVVDGREGPEFDGIADGALFSPDSQRVAYAAERRGEWLVVVDGKMYPAFDGVMKQGGLVFSPNSQRVAYAARVKRTGKWSVVVDGKQGAEFDEIGARTLRFSPDSQRVAYVAGRSGKRYVVLNGKESRGFDDIAAEGLLFSPNSQRTAYVGKRGKDWIAVVDGQETKSFVALKGLVFEGSNRLRSVALHLNESFNFEFVGLEIEIVEP